MIGFAGLAIAAVMALGGWGMAQSRDKSTGQPVRPLVRLGAFLAALGLLVGVLTLPPTLTPPTYAAGLAAVLMAGVLIVRSAAMRAVGWTALAEAATTAVGLAWARPGRAFWSLLAGAGGLALAAALVERGEALAGLLGAMVMLAPARWWMRAGWKREANRTAMERAAAGVLSGGHEWSSTEAADRGSPIKILFDRDQRPTRVTMPLPPPFGPEHVERFQGQVAARFAKYGFFTTACDQTERYAVAEVTDPLPTEAPWPGTLADGYRFTLGLARVSPLAAEDGVGPLGAVMPFVWDLGDTQNALIVGRLGGGKSVLVRLIILQAAMAGWRVTLLDPKRVEFSIFRGRQGIEQVATRLEEMATAFAEGQAEMDRRLDLLERTGKQKVQELADPPPPILIVCDEAFELFVKEPGSDDETKAVNELRARCASSARALAALGRATDVHLVLLAQRADAEVIKGTLQNNLPGRMLMRPKNAGSTQRSMIDLKETVIQGNCPGRAVMKTDNFPESEVQVYYVDAADLDKHLPKIEQPEAEKPSIEGHKTNREQPANREHEASESTPGPVSECGESAPQNGEQTGTDFEPESSAGSSQNPEETKPGKSSETEHLGYDFMKDFEANFEEESQ